MLRRQCRFDGVATVVQQQEVKSYGGGGRLLGNLVFGTATGRKIKINGKKSKVEVSHGTNGVFSMGVTLERQEDTRSRINRTSSKEESRAAGAAR